jgi:hypothetical protein
MAVMRTPPPSTEPPIGAGDAVGPGGGFLAHGAQFQFSTPLTLRMGACSTIRLGVGIFQLLEVGRIVAAKGGRLSGVSVRAEFICAPASFGARIDRQAPVSRSSRPLALRFSQRGRMIGSALK